MNILFTYPTLFNPSRGGVERVTDLLAKEFISRGHSVFYLNNKKNDELLNYEYPAEVSYFPYEDYKDKRNNKFYKAYLKNKNIDIVINQCGQFGDSILYCDTSGTKAKVLSVIHMNPLMNYEHLFSEISKLRNHTIIEKAKRLARILIYPKIKYDYFNNLKRQFDWLIENNPGKVVLLSDSFKNELYRLSPDFPKDKVISIANPNTYEIEGNLPKEKIILYVGRFDKGQKRPDRVLKIWKKLAENNQDWKLIMIGDGPERASLKKMAKSIPNVEFVGFRNPEPYYRKGSLLCMTSNFEGFGMVLVEAMSKGCVPVAFDSYTSLHDIISDPMQIVTPFSLDEFTQKLQHLMTSDKDFKCLQSVGYKSVEKFSRSCIGDAWEREFQSLVKS